MKSNDQYTVADLRDEVIAVFQKCGTNEEPLQQAKVKSALASTVVKSARVELDYKARTGNGNPISFLEA